MSEVITYKCPNCTGPLLFDPSKQLFHCDYCGSEFTEADLVSIESAKTTTIPADEADALTATDPNNETSAETSATTTDTTVSEQVESATEQPESATLELFSCPSCGAQVVTDETTAATFCYYCHNPVVLTGRVSGDFLPEALVPFSIDRDTAVSEFIKWTKRKKYVPKDFFDATQIEKITGVYFPYWMVNSQLEGEYTAKATKIRVWRTGDIEMTETKFFNIQRKGSLEFKNLIKNALTRNQTLAMIESVQPFDTHKAKAFSSKYLAGFQADKRDVPYQDIAAEVQKEFKGYAQNLLSETVNGYTTVSQEAVHFPNFSDKESYILLPVWLLTYRNKNKPDALPYYYAMNGESGKVSGKLPIDKKKLGLSAFALFAGVFALILLGGWFI